MRPNYVTRWATVLAAASLALGSSISLPSSAAGAPPGSQPELSQVVKDHMLERIGHGLARSLGTPAVRGWLSREIAASPYVEYRVPIRDLLLAGTEAAPTAGTAAPPEVSLLRREASLTGSDLATLRRFPHLELYLPLKDQRARWQGDSAVQVAVRRGTEDYTLFQQDGSSRVVPADYLPATPTLVLAVSEIDYADHESAVRGGARTGEGMEFPAGMALPAVRAANSPLAAAPTGIDTSQWTRSYSHLILNNQDGGLAGDDELEIFGDIGGAYAECRRYTGLEEGRQYFRSFKTTIAGIAEAIALAVPTDTTGLHVRAYEDDDNACAIWPADDYYGERTLTRFQYNSQQDLFAPTHPVYLRLGVTEYVNGQFDPTP